MSATVSPSGTSPTSTLEVIDPAVAAVYLGRNRSNRNIRKAHVTALASDMSAGRWQDDAESIMFDENGDLTDGQHRLLAVIESGQPIRVWVLRGVSKAAQEVIDAGAARSAADALKLSARVSTNHPAVAAAARLAILWNEGHHRTVRAGVNGARKVTNAEITAWVDDQLAVEASTPGALIITGAVGQARSWHQVNNLMSLSVSAFVYLMLGTIDVLAADEFFRKLDSLDFTGTDDPVQQLYLRFNEADRRKEQLRISEKLWFTLTAWNAYRAGRKLAHSFVIPGASGFKPWNPKVTTKGGVKHYPLVPDPV